jgi:hypothetical protein
MKLILTLSIFILSISTFTSCKNNKCKQCTTTTTQTVMGFDQTVSANSSYCGDDYDNAPTNNTVVQDLGGGVTQTVSISCVDK